MTLKAAVDAGRFGRLTLGETTCKWWRSQAYYDEGGWKGTKALDGGGALMNQAIHNVDLLLWMMGPATHVTGFTATLAHERIEVEDTAVACLRFANGALGVIQATTSVYPGLPKTIAVHGDKGTAVIEQEDVLRWEFTPETDDDRRVKERFAQKVGASGGSSNPAAISHVYHARQLADFVKAVESNGTPLVDGREGRRAVELIEAVYRSAEMGKTVTNCSPDAACGFAPGRRSRKRREVLPKDWHHETALEGHRLPRLFAVRSLVCVIQLLSYSAACRFAD